MKKLWIIAVLLMAVLLCACGYTVIEQDGSQSSGLTGYVQQLFGVVNAETKPSATPLPTKTATAQPSATAGQSAETPQPDETTAATESVAPAKPTPTPTPEYALQNGSRGDDVKAIQSRLIELGFMTGKADGIFGPKTEAGVKAAQEYLYNQEMAALLDEQDEQSEETAAPDALKTAQPEPTETEMIDVLDGADDPSAEDVVADEPAEGEGDVQPTAQATGAQAEATAAPDQSAAPGETADAAEASEESEEELEVTFSGIVDEALRDLLLSDIEFWQVDALSKGDRGDDVVRLQTRLGSLNYLSGGIDGIFGGVTQSAVIAFQEQNELTQSGVLDADAQAVLFSADAKKSPRPALPYVLKINVSKQKVYAYSWNDADGDYTTLVRSMTCSTGLKSTPTPVGTFNSVGPVARWGYFPKWGVYAQYLFRIKGPYLFHSVLYRDADEKTLIKGSLSKLGQRASHGCVRLSVADAKWIYNNCPANTKVVVY